MEAVANWLEGTALHWFVNNYRWVWPASETLHFLGLTLMIGTIGMFDLRLLGLSKLLPPKPLYRLVPLGIAGFVINFLTGILFFTGAPRQYIYNFAFQMKMLFVLLAGLNVLIYYVTGISRRTTAVKPGDPVPAPAMVVGGISLFLWIGVILWGRFLTFFRPPFN
jgi:hypothetical protein